MKTKLLYWDSLIVRDDLLENYKDAINKLLQGDYKSVHLEKLKHHKVFSIRVQKDQTDSATRLLFVEQEGSLVFLEEIKNHDYDKSKFLNNPPACCKR